MFLKAGTIPDDTTTPDDTRRDHEARPTLPPMGRTLQHGFRYSCGALPVPSIEHHTSFSHEDFSLHAARPKGLWDISAFSSLRRFEFSLTHPPEATPLPRASSGNVVWRCAEVVAQ